MKSFLRSFVVLGALGSLLVACGEETFCTLIACEDTVTAERTFSTTEASLEGAKVQFCRETTCTEATLTSSTPGQSVELFCVLPANVFHTCRVTSTASGAFAVDFTFRLAPDDAEDGETYTFTILSPTDPALPLVEAKGAASFTQVAPNGEACGPICDVAEI